MHSNRVEIQLRSKPEVLLDCYCSKNNPPRSMLSISSFHQFITMLTESFYWVYSKVFMYYYYYCYLQHFSFLLFLLRVTLDMIVLITRFSCVVTSDPMSKYSEFCRGTLGAADGTRVVANLLGPRKGNNDWLCIQWAWTHVCNPRLNVQTIPINRTQ